MQIVRIGLDLAKYVFEVHGVNCNKMAGDGETVTPSLPEPGVWTGMASANV
jgi:hypothetical protein